MKEKLLLEKQIFEKELQADNLLKEKEEMQAEFRNILQVHLEEMESLQKEKESVLQPDPVQVENTAIVDELKLEIQKNLNEIEGLIRMIKATSFMSSPITGKCMKVFQQK